MSLQTLPDVILLGINNILLSKPQDDYYDDWPLNNLLGFKRQLYLLAVFQRLRVLALPKIYRHIYIISNECFTSQKHAKKHKKPILENVDTNAKIIALANCTHFVKSATIHVFGSSTTCAEFQYPIEALRACANSWPNVTTLDIRMNYNDDDYYNLGDADPTPSPRLCKKYSRELAKILPNITELSLINDGFNSAISELFIQVADVYANQLINIINDCEIDHAGSQKFEMIQFFYIGTYSNRVLPRINSHTLAELHINNIPANVSWASFMDNKNDTVVEFSCLRKLHIIFGPNLATEITRVNKPELLLNFPVLNMLIIECRSEDGSFFEMAKFPDEMGLVLITAPPVLLARIKRMGMPTAKRISISG